ncbi:MAG: hypothetical protein CBR30_09680 [Dictyoglomus sp. NZ13-RE01]|nr:MAG: hypothetical protein CBR30_09680 [Dictyoglomus sp. NZ13-RE01]
MAILLFDEETINEIIGFFNPRNKRYYLFLRNPANKRFVKRVRTLYICITCTFKSVRADRHFSKNLYVESQGMSEVGSSEWELCDSDSCFHELIESKIREAQDVCERCFANFGVDYEIGGAEYRTAPCEIYCRAGRPLYGTSVIKNWREYKT